MDVNFHPVILKIANMKKSNSTVCFTHLFYAVAPRENFNCQEFVSQEEVVQSLKLKERYSVLGSWLQLDSFRFDPSAFG